MEKLQALKIPLEDIISATNNFHKDNLIAKGGFGNVYKGELSTSDGMHRTVVVKRLDSHRGQGKHEFLTEITLLSRLHHENLVSFVGYSDEHGENILVFLYESNGSLDKRIHDTDLNWMQRLQISIDVARGLNYLHYGVETHHRVLHRDIKSANILLDKDLKAKVSDFGLSVVGPSNVEYTYVVVDPVGTRGYVDPAYCESNILTKESDVYSLGVVLFEILCGQLAYQFKVKGERRDLGPLAQSHYEQNKLDEIINPELRKQMQQESVDAFALIAYQCLNSNRSQRPTMSQVLGQLEKALQHQVSSRMSHNDSSKQSSSSDPEDSKPLYIKNNVSIHPSQRDTTRINGRLKLNKQGSSLFMTWIPYEGQTSNMRLSEKDKNLYTIKAVPFSDIQSIRRHIPTIELQYVSIVLSSGLAFPRLYFYSGGIREFIATIKQHISISRSSEDADVYLVNNQLQVEHG